MHRGCNPGCGALYRVVDGRAHVLRTGLGVPNGICFSPSGDRAYFADSAEPTVYSWELSDDGFPIGAPRPIVDGRGAIGAPDGAIADSAGDMWSAAWDDGCVNRYSPDGALRSSLPLPVSRPTCPALGSASFDTLYVTSARVGLTAAQRAREPLAGGVFAAPATVSGIAEPAFRG